MRGYIARISIVLSLVSATVAFAKAPAVPRDNVVRVGYFESTGMFEGASDGADKRGYCYDYMMHIATYTGWRYEFCYGSFADLYDKLRDGEIDILPYTNFNDQRGKEVLFSDSALAIEEYFLALPKGSKASDDLHALNGGVITTMTNADYNSLLFDFIRENGLDVQVNYFHYVDEIWDELREGRADATIYTSNSFSKDDWDCVYPFGKKPTYICVAKEREDLLVQLNEAIDLIDKESPGYKESLYANYFSDNPARKYLTAEERDWVNAHPVLHLGCLTNDEPDIVTYDAQTHSATGLTVDIINGIIDRLDLGISADYTCYASLAEMYEALDAGEIDVIYPYYQSPDIAQKHNLYISNSVRVATMALVYKNGRTYQDAFQKIAASTTRLGAYYVNDYFPGSEIVNSTTIADAVKKVRKGVATGAIAHNTALQIASEQYNNLNSIMLSQGCGTCFAARPANFPLLRVLNRGLIYISDVEIVALSSQYANERRVSLKAFLITHKAVGIMALLVLLSLAALVIILLKVSSLREKADAANSSKTLFLNSMSHDIRTPLNAIIGYTSMTKKCIDDKDRAVDYLDKIGAAGNNLLDLVNQVLDMSRIESGTVVLSEDSADIVEKAHQMVEIFRPSAQSKNIALSTSIGQIKDRRVYADSGRVNQLIINLLGNAIKYTPEGGTITYYVSQTECDRPGYGTYVLTVEDNGIGISKKYLETIFEPFTRESSSTISKIQGTGLGMAIVKRLVDLMGGSIDIESEPGKGTRMSVTLTFKLQEDVASGENDTAMPAAPVSLEGKRTLLVEDNEMNREITTMILEEHGIQVETAEDGDIAVDKVKAIAEQGRLDRYDFILMDVQMPRMDGYEATNRIRGILDPQGVHIPIIALSANAFEEDRLKSIEAGMDEHVAKPIDIDKLLDTLSKCLS